MLCGCSATFICIHGSVAQQRTRLSDVQLDGFKTWFLHHPTQPIVRRLTPLEELRAMGWCEDEVASTIKSHSTLIFKDARRSVYQRISESICPNVFAAIAARMLWAMGKALPDGVATEEAAEEYVLCRVTKRGIPYMRTTPLRSGETDLEADDGDETGEVDDE